VFSAVGAINIGIGDEPSSGPDLLVSYHENNHYNSVQDESIPRSFRHRHTPAIVNSNAVKMSPTMMIDNDDTKDSSTRQRKNTNEYTRGSPQIIEGNKGRNRRIQNMAQNMPKQKRNDFCGCGSGLRYKKCCLAASKDQVRLAKWRDKHGLGGSEEKDGNERDRAILEGGFCVLNI